MTRHGACALRQTGQVLFVDEVQRPRLGGIEHVVRETIAQLRQLHLDFLEARLRCRGQFGTGEAEIAQGIVDDSALRVGQLPVFAAGGNGLVRRVHPLILGQLGKELRQLRQTGVVNLAHGRRIDHGVEVRNRRPQPRQPFLHVLEWLGNVCPRAGLAPGKTLFQQRATVGQLAIERGQHVLRANGRESGQPAGRSCATGIGASMCSKVQQGIGNGVHDGGNVGLCGRLLYHAVRARCARS